ncbi:retinol dehydrogenase 11 [Aspergillus cavernicola]|uniref:Retinol dehydrogenase 11 n=1 Tax=Aspergillus cavernicola TaxID=176166 RepID=A0ABR4I4Y3_9EURO
MVFTFNPDKEIPDLAGKVFFITGGTAGLGASTTLELAKHNAVKIYISGRNAHSAKKLIEKIQSLTPSPTTTVTFVKCDLTSLSSVKAAATEFLAQESRLDVLICNAGVMATPPGLTSDGFEIQFGTNHLGHAMLIRHLLPLLQATASKEGGEGDARIISLTSLGFKMAPLTGPGINFSELTTPQNKGFMWSWFRYGQSKLANLIYAKELARRYPAITTVSVHPGVVGTGLLEGLSFAKRWFVYITNMGRLLGPEEGAYSQLWAASTAREKLVNWGAL